MSWVVPRKWKDGQTRYTGAYRDRTGRVRSVGTFPSRREAERAARRAEGKVEDGSWIDPAAGRITFHQYVEQVWWPSRQLEVGTRAGYRSYLDKHFLPFFGQMAMADITASTVQAWVTKAMEEGLSPRSVVKYHVMLHGVFKRAVRDRVIAYNPCAETELPKVVVKKSQILTPQEFQRLFGCLPKRLLPLVLTEIETGLRWGELIALRPRYVDFLRRTITVEETIVEVSRKNSPTGERYIIKPYPKDDESRVIGVRPALLDVLAAHIERLRLGRDDLLFSSTERAGGMPLSRNTFRTRYWRPALAKAGLGVPVRMHDLRHVYASWLQMSGIAFDASFDRVRDCFALRGLASRPVAAAV